jgi:hypothetical protein
LRQDALQQSSVTRIQSAVKNHNTAKEKYRKLCKKSEKMQQQQYKTLT